MLRRAVPAFGLIAILTLALPALASANWTHKGKGELKENASVTISGELSVNTSVGKVTCPTSISGTLTASGSAGDVTSYTVSEPSKCDLTESLGAVCGTNGVSKVEKTGTWGLTAKESSIEISSIDLHLYFGKCLIPNFRIKGTATATPDKTTAMSTLALSGSQTLYNSLGEEVGSASLSGSPSVSPAGTYGVKTAPLVKTKWLMSNKHLSKNEEMTLGGSFSFSYAAGTVTCTVSATLSLTAGEVEEEEPEGEVKSFTVAEPSKCSLGGELSSICKKGVASVEKTGTWNLNATESDISASGLVLDYKFKECSISSLRVSGAATLSVDDATKITKATFSGSPSVFNSSEETVGTAELGGSPSASPSGTYAIKATSCGSGAPKSSEWSHEGELIDKSCTEEFSGWFTAVPVSGLGGMACTTHMTFELKPEGGKVTDLDVTTATCEGIGAFEGCKLVTFETLNEITLSPTKADFDIENLLIEESFAEVPEGPGCAAEFAYFEMESLTATPDVTSTISSITLSGSTTLEVFGLGLESEVEGELEAANPGTFGIG